jgi:hypothetical protein
MVKGRIGERIGTEVGGSGFFQSGLIEFISGDCWSIYRCGFWDKDWEVVE